MILNKKTVLLSLLMMFLTGVNALASADGAIEKNMRISVNPGALLLGNIPLNFEVAVADNVSLGVNASGQFFALGENMTYYGGGGGLSAKFHLSNRAFVDGWYVKPAINAEYSRVKFNSLNGKFFVLGPSVNAGYDWVWDSGFSIGFGLGAQFKHIFANASTADEKKLRELPFGMRGIIPSGEFTIGWVM